MSQASFGRTTVSRLIGRGALGEVFEARDPALDRVMAVKAIYPHLSAQPGFPERFRTEVRFAARLLHPGIARLWDADTSGERPFVVTDYLEGGSLRERLAGQPLPIEQILPILDGIAAALDYGHVMGAVHGDITPSNVLFDSQGRPVLTDWGLLRAAGPGAMLGAPAYMSPEQAAGKPADARSDLYSLGVVLFEMCTGTAPFAGDTPMAVLMQHLNAPPPSASERNPALSPPVAAVLARCLSKAPGDRYASAGEIAAALHAALGGQSAAQPTAPAAPQRAALPATPVTTPAIAAAAVAAGAAATVAAPEAEPRKHWLTRLTSAVAVVAPLVGRGAPDMKEAPRDRRTVIATILGIVSILFAVFQFLEQFLNLVARPFAPLMKALPYIVAVLFVAGAALSLVMVLRGTTLQVRKRAGATLAVITVAGLVWGTWALVTRLRPPSGFIVAVAEFDGSQATQRVDFSRRIYESLRSELTGSGGKVQVMRTGEVYKDAAQARARGSAIKATLVIWGWYDDAGVRPSVEALQVPTLEREASGIPSMVQSVSNAISQGMAPSHPTAAADVSRLVRVPATMPDFDLFVKNGPQQMTYVSEALLGVAFYLNGEADRAIELYNKALAGAPAGGTDVVGQEVVYFQRSVALFEQSRTAEAVSDLERAVGIKADFYEAHFNLGIAYTEVCSPTRQLARAVSEVETAIALKPDSAQAHRLLADLLRQSGKLDRALEEAQAAAKLQPDEPASHELLGAVQEALGQTEAAAASRQKAVALRETALARKSADRVAALFSLGDAYMAAGQYDKALAEYQSAQKLAPNDFHVHRALGNAYYWQNKPDLAEREYLAWAEASPKDVDARLLLGILYDEQKKPAQAVEQLKQAAALAACDPAPHLVLAGVLWEQDNLAGATSEARLAVAIDPQSADAQYSLGVYLWQGDQLDESEKALLAAVALAPESATMHYALGETYMGLGEYDKAVAEWTLTCKYDPSEPSNYSSLANALEKANRLDDAAAAYQKSLSLKDDAVIRVWLGMIYQQQGKLDLALPEHQKSLQLNPTQSSANWALGEVYAAQGKLDDAAAAFLAALKVEDIGAVHGELAAVRARQGRTADAIAEYGKAATLDAKDWSSRLAAGDLLQRANRLDEAATQYEAALAINQSLPGAHYGLAVLAYKRCSLSTMEQEARATLALAPDQSFYKAQVAAVLDAQGKPADAARMYAELQSAPPTDLVAHLLASDYFVRSGKPDDAKTQAQAVLNATGVAPVLASAAHALLGQAYLDQERPEPARNEFALALAALPSNADAQVGLGDVAFRSGEITTALAAYDKALEMLPEYALSAGEDSAAVKAITIHVARALALTKLSRPADATQAYDSALKICQQLLELAPSWSTRHFALAVVYLARGDTAKAEGEFATAVSCDRTKAAARTRAEAWIARMR